jgi:YggT family protein
VGQLLIAILNLINLLVLIRVLLSYFPNIDMSNPAVRLLYDVTEPILRPIRNFLREQFPGTAYGPIDWSPLALFVIILLLTRVIQAAF